MPNFVAWHQITLEIKFDSQTDSQKKHNDRKKVSNKFDLPPSLFVKQSNL